MSFREGERVLFIGTRWDDTDVQTGEEGVVIDVNPNDGSVTVDWSESETLVYVHPDRDLKHLSAES